jgi:oxygen-dependent protoporphyrinogen oxidase
LGNKKKDAMASESVIIVGAGIAGLTAAYHLSKLGFDVTVLEASNNVGGRMATDAINGYVIDSGAQFLSSAYPIIKSLIKKMGLVNDFIKTSPWAAIRRNGTIHRFRYDDVFSPVRSGLLGWGEWFSLGWNSMRQARKLFNLSVSDYSAWAEFDTEYATNWYNAQYGTWMTEYIIEPMLEGFYFQTPEETSRALPMAVSALSLHGAKTMTLLGGIDSLTKALASRLQVSMNETVEKIITEENNVRIYTNQRVLQTGRVILAVPAHTAKDLYRQADKIESILMDTHYSSTLNIALGVTRKWTLPETLQDVYGLLMPRKERKHIAAIAIERAKSTDRTQNGHLINVMLDGVSGSEMIEWDDDKILKTLLPELDEVLPAISHHIIFQKHYRWLHAEPKSPIGRSKNIAIYRKNILPDCRVLLAGDYMGMPFTEGAAETGQWAASQLIGRG